jgi:hypothetical protein
VAYKGTTRMHLGCLWKNFKLREHLENLDVGERIILKLIWKL